MIVMEIVYHCLNIDESFELIVMALLLSIFVCGDLILCLKLRILAPILDASLAILRPLYLVKSLGEFLVL